MVRLLFTRDLRVCLALSVLTLGTYANVGHFDFLRYDDQHYPLNAHVRDGLTADSFRWAFTSVEQANWHPLTWLSHLLDYQLYGPNAGADHVTGLAIHLLATLMLFVFLRRATNAFWRSALVAFIFALHPLHVESVAWISERKDVLCAFFWFLTSWLWVRYAEAPSPRRYLVALLSFALGVLSKPMIVTLPLVLLLLDFWPLGRQFQVRLLLEKIPFIALSAASSVITWFAQSGSGATQTLVQYPLGLRVENALASWVIYAGKAVWPNQLALFYNYPVSIPFWRAISSAIAILAVSLLSLLYFRTLPWLAVGWFWHFLTLIPVIGLVQVGHQARADRYMYIPIVGLAIMLAWGAAAIVDRWPGSKTWIAAPIAVWCAALIPVTWVQVQYWQDNETLFAHSALTNIGNGVDRKPGVALTLGAGGGAGELKSAADPESAQGRYDQGVALMMSGHTEDAIADFKKALQSQPLYPEAHNNLGTALARQGKWAESVAEFRAATLDDPDYADAYRNLGMARIKIGRMHEPADSLRNAVRLNPRDAATHNMLGYAMADEPDRLFDAIAELRVAIELDPGLASAHENLGRLLSQNPANLSEAIIGELEKAQQLRPLPNVQQFLDKLKTGRVR